MVTTIVPDAQYAVPNSRPGTTISHGGLATADPKLRRMSCYVQYCLDPPDPPPLRDDLSHKGSQQEDSTHLAA